jgi:hypothetical protein
MASTGQPPLQDPSLEAALFPFFPFRPLPFLPFPLPFLSFLNAPPRAAIPARIPSAIMETVGAPPTRTRGPAGTERRTLVGRTMDLVFVPFFFGLGGGGIPIS